MQIEVNPVFVAGDAERRQVLFELRGLFLGRDAGRHGAAEGRHPRVERMPAVDKQVVAGHIVRRVGRQKDYRPVQILRPLDIPQRRELPNLLANFERGRRVHRRKQITRTNRIHIDIVRAPFRGEHARHLDDRRLTGVIRDVAVADPRGHRRGINNLAARPLLNKDAPFRARAEPHARKIHANDLIPIVERIVGVAAQNPDTGVIYANIQFPEPFDDRGDGGVHARFHGHVARLKERIDAERIRKFRRDFRARVRVPT